MTLPFSIGKARSWQCFVCGVQHSTYEEFCEHIKKSHEEGREYLVCPKCSAPIRDVKAHYKFKHSGWGLPTGVPLRAVVWNDFSPKGRRKKKVNFKTGEFESKKNGRSLHYRSGLEEQVYEILEQMTSVVSYNVEPIEIPYNHEGQWHQYRPDLAILYSDGTKKIIEIKPKDQTSLGINQAKWTFANEYCLHHGWQFEVLTEVGIAKLKSQLRRQRKNSGS